VIDASRQVQQWFTGRCETWRRQGVEARLRLPSAPLSDKAVITFEEASHICSVTVSRGKVEFILMRTDAPPALVSFDREFGTAAELGAILEAFARQLARVAPPTRATTGDTVPPRVPVRSRGRRPSRA